VRKKIWENYRTEPVGGNLGNLRDIVLKSENISGKFRDMQCGDWSDLFLKGLEISIDKWYYNNANSFIVEHINTPGLNLPGNNLLSNLGEHNLIRIRTGRKSIYIDPWKSGGRKILKEEKEINIQKYKVFDNNGIKTGYPVPGGIILNQNHTKGKKRNFSHTIFQCFL
jgi:hypothetical protein